MKFRKRDYKRDELEFSLSRHSATAWELPLRAASSISDKKNRDGGDRNIDIAPTSNAGAAEKFFAIDDPLRAVSVQSPPEDLLMPKTRASRHSTKKTSEEFADSVASEWDLYKASIMQRFASTGTITVSTKKSVMAAHLEELEDPEKEAREETKIISQQEYVTRLRELNNDIAHAWLNNERVSALRLSIKVARLLMDTSVPQFYPTLFVLVTDVMDTVGNLVWIRIKKKAEIDDAGNSIAILPVDFTSDDVRQEAKDTCNNWFYKIGCIRELLPRIYLEIAILRCMHFLEKDPPLASFQRLTMMMRGLSDPLASAYAHLYLARHGQALLPSDTGYLISGLNDFLVLFRRVLSGEFDKHITLSGLDRRLYVSLVEPVIEWIMQCILKNSNQEEMAYVWHAFGERQPATLRPGALKGVEEGLDPVSVVVHYLLKQLPAAYVGNNALDLSRMIKSSYDISLPQHLNYRLLGAIICECNPPQEMRLAVLNDVWKVVMKYGDLVEYLAVADVFLDYILQNCSEVEMITMLGDILRHLHQGDVTDSVLASLEAIVSKLLMHYKDLTEVLNVKHVVELLDIFYGDTRLSVYKQILTSISRQKVQDPVTRHFLFEQAQVLHDSLDSLSSDDDCRQTTLLIARFVQLVDFGHDLEQHLAFLVDCRAAFGNMDLIYETVVHASNRLAITALQMAKGSHSKRTREFVKACITFNEISIPSITSVVPRIHLFLETAQAALMNAMLSHTEGLLKAALTCLQDVPSSRDLKAKEFEEGISSFLHELSSFLVVVPGHPELGAFYILRGLLNLIESQSRLISGRRKVRLLCGILCLLCAIGQEQLPFHVGNQQVDSDDTLYFGDTLFHKDLADITTMVVNMLVTLLDQAADKVQGAYQALDVCNAFLTTFNVDEELNTLCSRLLQQALTSLAKSDSYLQATLQYSEARGCNQLIS
ncbi:unnamed protein product [Sphagnum jensenii]|uniref:Esophageal cancer associated protein n=1 Tax=Sphagnum jensenii TaxID=128206 RepID=A0ABP1B6P9_9BRYO